MLQWSLCIWWWFLWKLCEEKGKGQMSKVKWWHPCIFHLIWIVLLAYYDGVCAYDDGFSGNFCEEKGRGQMSSAKGQAVTSVYISHMVVKHCSILLWCVCKVCMISSWEWLQSVFYCMLYQNSCVNLILHMPRRTRTHNWRRCQLGDHISSQVSSIDVMLALAVRACEFESHQYQYSCDSNFSLTSYA